jgi:peptide deformylase
MTRDSNDLEEGWEGCFSVPGIMGRVSRSKEITVRYLSIDGKHVEDKFTGYVARVVGHEIDHLSNVEFLDRMDSMESITTAENYVQFHCG